MTFLNPVMLWSLAVLAPLLAIYLLKVRPRKKQTTAYFLWDSIFQQRSTSSLFSRLRDVWSLLLMALAAAAICFALARPEWSTEKQDLLIVIDNSASMGALDGGRSRLELAKEVAAELIDGLNGSQRAAIATINNRLNYHSHLSENPRELLEAIEKIEITDQELNLRALPSKKASDDESLTSESTIESSSVTADDKTRSQDNSDDARTIFISDGCFEAEQLTDHVELLKVSRSLENVGLIAADMAFQPGSEDRVAFYFQLNSTFKRALTADLLLSRLDDDGAELLQKVIPLNIEPGESKPEIFEIDDALPGRWLAKLELEDALAIDNTVWMAVNRPPPIRVAVDDTNRFFFENSVLAFSQNQGLMTLVQEQPEIVLASGSTPEKPMAIIFQPKGESPWWSELGDEIEVGVVREVVADHPALRYLEPTTMPFGIARQLTVPAGAQVLLADDRNTPLIYVARSADRSALVVNLDPAATEFYFSAWFPVLIHSGATWLSGRDVPLAATYRPGSSVRIPGRLLNKRLMTSGDEERVELSQCGFTPLRSTTAASEASSVDADRDTTWIGCSLLSGVESKLDNDATVETAKPVRRGQSPSWWLTLLAILILSGESILYHRRRVG